MTLNFAPVINVEVKGEKWDWPTFCAHTRAAMKEAYDSFDCELEYKTKRALQRIDAFDERCEFN
ncbi:MAG: hypothetical protein ACREQI_11760 [Candidatus Binataceae bacterium]